MDAARQAGIPRLAIATDSEEDTEDVDVEVDEDGNER
jgi:hypothetical protein